MENSSLAQVLISWFPMLLLIAVWLFFMLRLRKKGTANPYEGVLEEMRRQTEILDRIAKAIEKR